MATTNALYLTNTGGKTTQSIALTIRLTNPGARLKEYSTKMNGTPGMDGHVVVNVESAINYGDITNLTLNYGPPVTLKAEVPVNYKEEGSDYINHYENGTVGLAKIIISPNTAKTGHNVTFKYTNLSYRKILNEDVSTGYQNWSGDRELAFSCLSETGNQCSVAMKRTRNQPKSNQLIIWYPITPTEQKLALDGAIFFKNGIRTYRVDVQCQQQPKYQQGIITFLGLELIMNDTNSSTLDWHSQTGVITTQVYDIYGNVGTFEVRWDEEEYYLIPSL